MAKKKQLSGAAKFTHTLKHDYGNGESMAKGIENLAAASRKAGVMEERSRWISIIGKVLQSLAKRK